MKSKQDLRERLDNASLYIMTIPGVILFLIFSYLPMFGIVMAFKDYSYARGIWKSPWVGLKNFEVFFRSPDAWVITRNTLAYNISFIILGTILAIIMALALSEITNKLASKVYQTIALMPHFLSYVIVAYIAMSFLASENGVLNTQLLPALGMDPISWYSEPKYWPFILFFVKNWKGIGYSSIVYLAAIAGINPEYFEAASVDGASRFKQIIHITLPSLKSMIVILTIMSLGGIFNADFGLFYNIPMNAGLLKPTTNVLSTYIYAQKSNVSFATAAGLYVSLVGFAMVMTVNGITRKFDPDSSLF